MTTTWYVWRHGNMYDGTMDFDTECEALEWCADHMKGCTSREPDDYVIVKGQQLELKPKRTVKTWKFVDAEEGL